MMSADMGTPYLQGRGLSKSFGHVRALQDIDIDIYKNEILAIVGDNGAGKSTLTKILSGVYQPDSGDLHIQGQPVRFGNSEKARDAGIATVFQNLALVDVRDVAQNLFLGREPTKRRFFVDRDKMLEDAKKVIEELRVNIPSLTVEVGQLSGGQRQSIAIGRATSQPNRNIIIMDEPTAALGVRESRKVLDLILHLKQSGIGVVIISHNMRHVFSIADRILVLRHGKLVGVRPKSATSPDEIVKMIVGVEVL
jgi:ABC-type sugar transport system ATPase subunit